MRFKSFALSMAVALLTAARGSTAQPTVTPVVESTPVPPTAVPIKASNGTTLPPVDPPKVMGD